MKCQSRNRTRFPPTVTHPKTDHVRNCLSSMINQFIQKREKILFYNHFEFSYYVSFCFILIISIRIKEYTTLLFYSKFSLLLIRHKLIVFFWFASNPLSFSRYHLSCPHFVPTPFIFTLLHISSLSFSPLIWTHFSPVPRETVSRLERQTVPGASRFFQRRRVRPSIPKNRHTAPAAAAFLRY